MAIKEVADAGKDRRGKAEALDLAKQVETIIVAKGSRLATFDMKNDPPNEEILLAHLLGPTGNLRAPTLRKGKTLLIGFNEDAYRQTLCS